MKIIIEREFNTAEEAMDFLRHMELHTGGPVRAEAGDIHTPAAPKKPLAKKAEAPAPVPVIEVGKMISNLDVQAALETLFAAKGMNGCLEVLSRYGVKFARDLNVTQYADFIAHTEKVVAGGAV